MDWNSCISSQRKGQTNSQSIRTQYQRDYDRIIFSSAFRRLQNKTQVFPLPGNTFVHNRLTHSLEVSSVGRSLGSIVGAAIADKISLLSHDAREFYNFQLPNVIAAGCLAHDLGNPPFGHSGEDAISNYFKQNATTTIEGQSLEESCTHHEWSDLTSFEGNANALHIITNHYKGKFEGGMALTYSTLASIIKYPCASIDSSKKFAHRKKYGYFVKDEDIFDEIASSTSMIKEEATNRSSYKRHPFVYLVEAADDICYRIIDLEDAHRINIINYSEIETILLEILNDIDPSEAKQSTKRLAILTDHNEAVSYLRAKVINSLVNKCAIIFIENKEEIITGSYLSTLYGTIEQDSPALKYAKDLSIQKIYNHQSVVQLEITGYRVIYELLDTFVPISLKSNPTKMEEKLFSLIPSQYKVDPNSSVYLKLLSITDFIAGMTDGYATELYRKCNGIIIDKHK